MTRHRAADGFWRTARRLVYGDVVVQLAIGAVVVVVALAATLLR